jgi:hypothetical protein
LSNPPMLKFTQFFDMKRSETELLETAAMRAASRIFVSSDPFVLFRGASWLRGTARRPCILHHALPIHNKS